jgi:hypothetical protein
MDITSNSPNEAKGYGLKNPKLSNLIRHALRDKPQIQDEKTESPDNLISINATHKLVSKNNLLYRILFLEQSRELALIVSPQLPIEFAKAGLKELKQISASIQEGRPQVASPGAQIFLEYEKLMTEYGWTLKEIEEQVSYDFLITLIMSHNSSNKPEIKEYAKYFQDALMDYMRIKQTIRPTFLAEAYKALENEELPFSPDGGLIPDGNTPQKHKDARRAWNKELANVTFLAPSGSILVTFWIVSILEGYWSILDTHEDLQFYNKHKRAELIEKCTGQLFHRSDEWTDNISQDFIQSFLSGIDPDKE